MKLSPTKRALLLGPLACLLFVAVYLNTPPAAAPHHPAFRQTDAKPPSTAAPSTRPVLPTIELTERLLKATAPKTKPQAPPTLPVDPDQARKWALQNLDLAFDWLASAPPGPQRDIIVEALAYETAQYLPEEAVALAERYNHGNYYLMESLVQQWAEQDEWAAESYTLALPTSAMKNRLVARIAYTRSQSDPALAATLVSQQIEPGPIQDEAVIAVLYQWTKQDLQSALQWVASFPRGHLRDRALAEIEGAVAYRED